MNITMTVTTDTAVELFSTIKGMSVLIQDDCPTTFPNEPITPSPATALPTQTPSVPHQTPVVPPQAPYIPIPAPSVPAPSVPATTPPMSAIPTSAPTAPPTTQAPAYTLEQLNRAGADLITAHPETMPQLNALMAELGVQTLSQLKPEMYGAVALRLRGLGASL